jgi:hypothetical protein
MSTASAVQFRCPICDSQRFKPVSVTSPSGPMLYECATCSFTFTDPLRFARRRAAMRTKSPEDTDSAFRSARPGIPRDPRLVNLEDEDEIQYWCGFFQCNEWRLRDAVTHVGARCEDIRGCLSSGRTIRRRQ